MTWSLPNEVSLAAARKRGAFEGKTVDEAAELMGCSLRTVHRCRKFAKYWLACELGDSGDLPE
jgi:hypothetical protein